MTLFFKLEKMVKLSIYSKYNAGVYYNTYYTLMFSFCNLQGKQKYNYQNSTFFNVRLYMTSFRLLKF